MFQPQAETDRPTGWITLITGHRFSFDPIDSAAIHIETIANNLANQCRWGGDILEFYSVAQHSVLASQLTSAEFALAALMHDASEAYMGDLKRPLKRILPLFEEIEHDLMLAIAAKYGFAWPMPPEVVEADNALLAQEHWQLRGQQDPKIWNPQCSDELKARLGEITPWTPGQAKRRFLKRFAQLTETQQQADMFEELERNRQRAMAIPLPAPLIRNKYHICGCGHQLKHHTYHEENDTYHCNYCSCTDGATMVTVG